MQCDICGQNKRVFLTELEGARIYVCQDCNPSGNGVVKREFRSNPIINPTKSNNFKPNQNIVNKHKAPKHFFKKNENTKKAGLFSKDEYDIVDNYGDLVRKARETKGLTIEDLAKNMKEQTSYLQKIEQGKLKPNDAVIFKIYGFLGLNLIKTGEDEKPDTERKEKEEVKEHKHIEPFSEVKFNNKRKLIY